MLLSAIMARFYIMLLLCTLTHFFPMLLSKYMIRSFFLILSLCMAYVALFCVIIQPVCNYLLVWFTSYHWYTHADWLTFKVCYYHLPWFNHHAWYCCEQCFALNRCYYYLLLAHSNVMLHFSSLVQLLGDFVPLYFFDTFYSIGSLRWIVTVALYDSLCTNVTIIVYGSFC